MLQSCSKIVYVGVLLKLSSVTVLVTRLVQKQTAILIYKEMSISPDAHIAFLANYPYASDTGGIGYLV